MNRIIKFRAWDKRNNIIRDVIEIIYHSDNYNVMLSEPTENAPKNWSLRKFDEVELMQFTGLCDRNGKEIYEGDRCEVITAMGPTIKAVVEFNDGCFDLKFDEKINIREWPIDRDYLKCHTCNYAVTVIGNIHEAPGPEKEVR